MKTTKPVPKCIQLINGQLQECRDRHKNLTRLKIVLENYGTLTKEADGALFALFVDGVRRP